MATTLRQQIVTKITERMALILTASGYETNAGQNVDEWRSDADLHDRANLPAIGVFDVSDDWEPESYGQHRYMHTMRVQLRCVATSTAEIRKVIGDVHTAINTDRGWSSLAAETLPISDRMIVDEAERKILGAIVEVEIKYRSTGFSPYTAG
jgi:hypothetical protein